MSAVPPASEQSRRRQLAVTKRRATGLLAFVSLVFLVTAVWGGDATWVGYLEATARAKAKVNPHRERAAAASGHP